MVENKTINATITWTGIEKKDLNPRPWITYVTQMCLLTIFDGDKEKVRQWWIKAFDKGLRKYNNKY